MNSNKHYCFRKFTDIALDLEKRSISSCCAAKITKINFEEFNSLLNYKQIVQERLDILNDKRVDSCEEYCYKLEDKNLTSYRTLHGYNKIFNTAAVDRLDVLDLSIGSRCNLTCSYCSKRYSRTWLNDIGKNGGYDIDLEDDDRFVLTPENRALLKLSQDALYSKKNFNLLYQSLSELNGKVDNIQITGGEPFLYNNLIDIVEMFPDCPNIRIYTGAGLTLEKFKEKFDVLRNHKNVSIVISAENIGKLYEFNRYENSYSNFLKIVHYVQEAKINYSFTSVISNITIFGFLDFVKSVDAPIMQNFCNVPSFLRLDVLDEHSKNSLIDQFLSENNKIFDVIIKNLQTEIEVPNIDRVNLSKYIQEFAKRRNLNLEIFPKLFLNWLNVVQ